MPSWPVVLGTKTRTWTLTAPTRCVGPCMSRTAAPGTRERTCPYAEPAGPAWHSMCTTTRRGFKRVTSMWKPTTPQLSISWTEAIGTKPAPSPSPLASPLMGCTFPSRFGCRGTRSPSREPTNQRRTKRACTSAGESGIRQARPRLTSVKVLPALYCPSTLHGLKLAMSPFSTTSTAAV